ncbi:CheR family methyltransferase [Winogradskyella endarachnes]|uniref:histidine kinase n=1 Tax=Winogradskyella endarachnes TaxID=2681965 RepID=A0A6L6U8Q9_9FLAO|nr:CheR family methyltransferase [Winogradskyella endarachnes]MUU77896.1 response regulator [Winogradskyella endarachnes]
MNTDKQSFKVVGIGASAGALRALQDLFSYIPKDTGMAFIIVQHLSPDFKSLMPELLAKYTDMPIYTAKDKQSIKPNCIYLNQPNKNLHVKGSKIYLLDKGPKHNLNLPIDIFFQTLGEEFKEKAIAIILSGTGSDGSRGIRTVKETGGIIIAQDPNDAQFDGMPNSAIITKTVDYIEDVRHIAEFLNFKQGKMLNLIKTFNLKEEPEINKILLDVFNYCNVDFRNYKKNTVLRRIEKRMVSLNIQNIFEYRLFVKNNDEEKAVLRDDFLIGVTRFFRDDEAFIDIKDKIVPQICNSKKPGEEIRIWVAGCSSGEEVYSLAILFSDYITKKKLSIDFKIFATDIDARSIDTASSGSYNIDIVNEISKKHIETYFFINNNKLQIRKSLREKIVFSKHNLISDPPFIKLDLISCRNLLIYLDRNIQRKVLQTFHFSLNINGFLFLGNSESLGNVATHFKTINTKWKIFQNISESKYSPNLIKTFLSTNTITSPKKMAPKINSKHAVSNEEYIYHHYLSKRFSPDAIFIDAEFNILFIKGNVGKKLYHTEGVFENNLLKIVDKNLAISLKNGVNRLKKTNKDILISNVSSITKEGSFSFSLKIHKPIKDENLKNCYLKEFSPDKRETNIEEINLKNEIVSESSKEQIEDLENELKIVKTELQNAIEELETANEELQSSNEELMATNEELQSTNEELQSVNEELYTVNTEMQEKNKELTNLSNDLSNLLDNTEIATLFLDADLCIRKFTPAIKKIFKLEEADIGRKLSNFTSNFDAKTTSKLITDSQNVLKKPTTIENQLRDINGNYYFQRISPFITSNKVIDGVVITIDNINKIKEIELELEAAELKYHELFQNLTEGFIHAKIITNKKGEAVDWEYLDVNMAYTKLIGKEAKDIVGKKVSEILPSLIKDPNKWIQKYGETALKGKKQTIEGYVLPLNKYFHVNTFCPKVGEFAGTISDFTELKKKEEALTKSKLELDRIQSITHVGSWTLETKTGEVSWSDELFRIFRLDIAEHPPKYHKHKRFFTEQSWNTLSKAVELAGTKGKPYELELNIIRDNGEKGWMWAKGEAVKEKGKIVKLRGSAQDITTIKENEKALIMAKKQAEDAVLANKHKNFFLANMSHEIRTPISSVLGFADLLRSDTLSKENRLRYIEIIDNNSKQLLNLINDIIDVSKIESDELKLVYKNCNVSDLIENLTLTFEQVKKQKDKEHLTLKPIIPDELKSLNINTDPRRLEQVVSNLINNAVKFSEKGTISYGFTREENYLRFFVKDEGIGIAKNKQKEIFERFKQVNYKDSAKYDGTGLGLSICKAIVTLLGGDITVESKRYKGTTFEFTIPIKLATALELSNTQKTRQNGKFLKNKSILIAEDNMLIRMLLEAILKKTGAKLLFANNGKIAVKYYKENPNVDLILLDIRMPEMSGIEAMDLILQINSEAKIIMQTAHAMEEEKNMCYEKGCVDFLSKPIVKEHLFDTLAKWIT